MKRYSLSVEQLTPNFIGSWDLQNPKICQGLVEYFDMSQGRQRAGESSGRVDTNVKDSVDLSLTPRDISQPGHEVFLTYFENLHACYCDYTEEWPFLENILPEINIGKFNIQKYCAGQHFKKIHTERASLSNLHRFFAFMTYLNDVPEGGSTYFSHYHLEIQPRQGLTLIWPAEWTHAHCGNPVIKGDKYIITGWLDFPV